LPGGGDQLWEMDGRGRKRTFERRRDSARDGVAITMSGLSARSTLEEYANSSAT
jgi:hypothetical protein